MNGKQAKKLRKLAGYHPSEASDYQTINRGVVIDDVSKKRVMKGTAVNNSYINRAVYQLLKKNYYISKSAGQHA